MFTTLPTRAISSLFVVALTMLLAACGGGGGSSSNSGTTTTPVAAAATLALSGSAATVSSTSASTLSATLRDGSGNPLSGVVVTFKTAGANFGAFVPVGGTALTGANGVATITLNAGTQSGADSVTATATVNNVTVTSNAFGFTATGTTNASVVAQVSLSASQTSVASDNSNATTISAIVVDGSNAAVAGVTVTFSADTGVLSLASAVTDASGRAQVTFSSGTTNPGSRTATISANTSGKSSQIPIRITGSTIAIAATNVSLVVGGTSTLTVTLKSPSNVALPNQTVTLTSSGTGVTLGASTGTTDANGVFSTTISAVSSGSFTITVGAVGETRNIALTVSGPSLAFQITAPAASPTPFAATIGVPVTVSVQVPAPTTSVTFVTTLGTWTANGSSVYTTSVTAGTATASLTSTAAGVANVQVFDTARQSSVNDTRVVTFTAACTTANKVTLQSTPSVVAPSSGGTTSIASLVATVTDAAGNPVGGCPVAFRIVNPTGGGENVTPAVVLTSATSGGANALGQASTTFTAGSLPSGAGGVQVRATVVQGATASPVVVTGTLPSGNDATIVIGGTAGSVAIGRSTVISDSASGTTYTLPMSVLVADSNGNPVANTVVSLSTWPIAFNVGGNICAGNNPTTLLPVTPGTFYFNEDANENLVRDANETGARRLYPSGATSTSFPTSTGLTPPNSAAGTLPATVTTNGSGVATFNLTYTKSNGGYIVDRIRARTLVQGTETLGELRLLLPVLVSDLGPPCLLTSSPYN